MIERKLVASESMSQILGMQELTVTLGEMVESTIANNWKNTREEFRFKRTEQVTRFENVIKLQEGFGENRTRHRDTSVRS